MDSALSRHAAAILANSFPEELQQIELALLDFRITVKDIGTPGGNESDMPKKFSRALRPAGWVETRIQGDGRWHWSSGNIVSVPASHVDPLSRA